LASVTVAVPLPLLPAAIVTQTSGSAHTAAAWASGWGARPAVGLGAIAGTNAVRLVEGTPTLCRPAALRCAARFARARRPSAIGLGVSRMAGPLPVGWTGASAGWLTTCAPNPNRTAPPSSDARPAPAPSACWPAPTLALRDTPRPPPDPATTTATSAIAATTAIRTALPAAPGRRRFPPLRGRYAASLGCPPA
jgi:hypothetical protein